MVPDLWMPCLVPRYLLCRVVQRRASGTENEERGERESECDPSHRDFQEKIVNKSNTTTGIHKCRFRKSKSEDQRHAPNAIQLLGLLLSQKGTTNPYSPDLQPRQARKNMHRIIYRYIAKPFYGSRPIFSSSAELVRDR